MSLSGMVEIPRLQAKQVYIPSPRLRGEGQGEGSGVLIGIGPHPIPLPQGEGESVGFQPTTPKATGLKPVVVYFWLIANRR
jgi:hypothetical protein